MRLTAGTYARRPSILWLAFAVLAFIGLGWGALSLTGRAGTEAPARVVRAYFAALVSDQPDSAAQYLTGTALTSFKRTAAVRPNTTSVLESLTVRWPVVGPDLAVAEVQAEVRQTEAGGRGTDLQGARVHLIRDPAGWKIYAIEPAPLPYEGGTVDKAAAGAVVRDYVQAVVTGDYDGALAFLAGQARTDAEATLAYVKQARMETKATEVRTSVVQTHGESVWIKAEYQVTVSGAPERPVTLLLEVRTVGRTPAIVRVSTL